MRRKRKTKEVRKYGKEPWYNEEERGLIVWIATPAGEAWLEALLKLEDLM
jgi:hypothetical protein